MVRKKFVDYPHLEYEYLFFITVTLRVYGEHRR